MKKNAIQITITLKDKRLNPTTTTGIIHSIQRSHGDRRINVYDPEKGYCLSYWQSEAEYLAIKRVTI